MRPALEVDEEQLRILRSAPELLPSSLKMYRTTSRIDSKGMRRHHNSTPQEVPYL